MKTNVNFILPRFAGTFLSLILAASLAIAGDKDGPVPQHDETNPPPPVPQGTDGSLCESGVSSGFPCKNVELLSRVTLANMGGGEGADSWGWKDEQTGRYYALMGRSNGTSFIDITDPESPIYLGNLRSTSGSQPWRDVKVYADHAFIVADNISNHGMQVFDLTHLRGVQTPQEFSPDTTYRNIGPAHNVAINEQSGFAYIAGSNQCNGGLHMVDVNNPKSPAFAGCFSADGYSHDVQCVTYHGPDEDHQGAEICFASNEDSVTIVDVSNKSAPVMLSKADYPSTAYSHQGWLDEEHAMFYLGDELDEQTFGMNTRTLMFDVSDLDDPNYYGAHQHSTSVIDHNLYVKGNFMYQANYMGGMRIFHINRGEATTLTEVAYFDTEPGEDSLEFFGAWNVYPYFDNGTILVSDRTNGLFVLRASLPDDSADSSPLNGQMSALWISEGLKNQGLLLFVGENQDGPYVFYAWFLYLDGEPTWLYGVNPFEYGDDEVTILAQKLSGLGFLTPSAELAQSEDIGDITIHVHGCNEIHVDYDFGSLGSQELEFFRLVGVEGRECKR